MYGCLMFQTYCIMGHSKKIIVLVKLFLMTARVHADTPANCTLPDVLGEWMFEESFRAYDSSIKCDSKISVERRTKIKLEHPDLAVDEFGNRGHWTMIYNQGFEVTVNERSYVAFSAYKYTEEDIISDCDRAAPGWARDVTLRHWSCFSARKVSSNSTVKVHRVPKGRSPGEEVVPGRRHHALVDRVNTVQTSWKARLYRPLLGLSHLQLLRRRGGEWRRLAHRPRPAPASEQLKMAATRLLPHLDWRNVSGVDYVTPVLSQGSCSSCYVFSTAGMLESRLRIKTRNTARTLLSVQEVLDCSQLSQGCQGGFPYLVARYAQDYGLVESSNYPSYTGSYEQRCRNGTGGRHYVARHRYIGGYFGGCNEEDMLIALAQRGPIVANYLSHDDLDHYSSGVYHHTGEELPEDIYPYHAVDHAVLLVGYGVAASGEKYWIVKNSWGSDWGDHGYFLMRRGSNECGIESLASEADPIP